MGISCCGTGTQDKVLRLNEILNESLLETIDVKDEAQDEVEKLRAELALVRSQGLEFLRRTLDAKAQSAAEIAKLREQLAESERLLGFFKASDNFHIQNDLILDADTGQRIGALWKAQGLSDPRELWDLD
jgi:hypothetical protein